MNLYLIQRQGKTGWDAYRGAVVAAETEEQARLIYPGDAGGYVESSHKWDEDKQEWGYVYEMQSGTKCWMSSPDWVPPKAVEVILLAASCNVDKSGVVLSDLMRG